VVEIELMDADKQVVWEPDADRWVLEEPAVAVDRYVLEPAGGMVPFGNHTILAAVDH